MWFREVHGIYVVPIHNSIDKDVDNWDCYVNGKLALMGFGDESHNQALSAGLKEACKLIKTD